MRTLTPVTTGRDSPSPATAGEGSNMTVPLQAGGGGTMAIPQQRARGERRHFDGLTRSFEFAEAERGVNPHPSHDRS